MTMCHNFKVWRTIRHVGKRDAVSYRAGLLRAGCRMSDWANNLLDCFETTSIDEEVDLGCASVAELGFKEATRFDMICGRIMLYGGTLCLPEDGPVLREQYLDQPMGEWLWMAMNAIRVPDRDLDIFGIEHDEDEDDLWIFRDDGDPSEMISPERRFIFRFSKRSLVT